MKKIYLGIIATFAGLSAGKLSYADAHLIPPAPNDPAGSEVHIAYESDTFTPSSGGKQLPGAAFAAPGDSYRFTLIREDKYANDSSYEIVKAIAGVHIDDYDWSRESGDTEPEWGEILINGKTMNTITIVPWDKRAPESSGLLEVTSDAEVSRLDGRLIPPYVFDVTEETKKGKWLIFKVTNIRKNGSTSVDGDAPFGSFVVNRIGYHVWYKKIRGKN